MLLITRPLEEALFTQKKLLSLNIPCFIEPLLSFSPLIYNIDEDCSALIITSGNALKLINKEVYKIKPLIVVGPQTYSLAKAQGFKKVMFGGKTVKELYNLVYKTFSHEKLLYLRGNEISFPLAESLAKDKINIKEQILYKMLPVKTFTSLLINNFICNEIKAVSLFSYKTALLFIKLTKQHLLTEKLQNCQIYVLSEKIGTLFPENNVHIASSPDLESFLTLLTNKW